MHATLTTLINRLDTAAITGSDVIRWGCPVLSFGDLSTSKVATLGLNPSNREFVDRSGNELQGAYRRFHTLNSLGIDSWSEVDARHLRLILDMCRLYFLGNPYDGWFRRLDAVVSGTRASYYDGAAVTACHLDLIPYATARKWTELTGNQRSLLMDVAGDTLGLLLRDSPVRILILNGRSVVRHFEDISDTRLECFNRPTWSLTRESKCDVPGIAYKGLVEYVAGVALRHKVLVLGFNHNIQSSFGVTTNVIHSIRRWIARASRDALE